jgi:hypothetical protein
VRLGGIHAQWEQAVTGLADTRTATIERSTHGIIVVRIRPDVDQTIDDAVANIAGAKAMSSGRCPILVDLRSARPLPAETRHYYSGPQLTETFRALALVVPGGAFGRMFGNVYLRVTKPGIPSQLFADEAVAIAWLRGIPS